VEGSGRGQIDVQPIIYGRTEENLKSMTVGALIKTRTYNAPSKKQERHHGSATPAVQNNATTS